MLNLLLTLILTIFLFNGCSQKAPELPEEETKPTYVYVYKKMPVLKNRPTIDTTVEKFNLYKKDHPTLTDMYIVNKEDLINASVNNKSLRKIVFKQSRDIRFYNYQNNKFNTLNKNNFKKEK